MKIIVFAIIGFLVFLSILANVYINVFQVEKLNDKETDVDNIMFGRVVFPRKENE